MYIDSVIMHVFMCLIRQAVTEITFGKRTPLKPGLSQLSLQYY